MLENMTLKSNSDLCRLLLEAISRGDIEWEDCSGMEATSIAVPIRGTCKVVGVKRSPAGHDYLLMKAENGVEHKELAKAFCRRHENIVIPEEIYARLIQDSAAPITSQETIELDEYDRMEVPKESPVSEDKKDGDAPTTLTRLPTNPNERVFAELISSLRFPSGNAPHIWFPSLAGTKDIDMVMWVPQIGLFSIELKAWSLRCIRRLSMERFDVSSDCPHSTRQSPWDQSSEARYDLLNFLKRDGRAWATLNRPFVLSTVALFNIYREELLRKFDSPDLSDAQSDFLNRVAQGTIFQEDFADGETLLARLSYVRRHPVVGRPPKHTPRTIESKTSVETLDMLLQVFIDASTQVTAYDRDRLRYLEEASLGVLTDIDWTRPVVCSGRIGTGKTFLGLRAALSFLRNARSNECRSALFLTFNRVLATDIRRLLSQPGFEKTTD
jgi:hypothetical protein